MPIVAPAILCANEDDYSAAVDRIHPFAERVHIDLTDGQFADSQTVGVNQIWWPQEWHVDIHAMVTYPSQYVGTLIQMKPDTICFHAEAAEDLLPILQKIKQAGIKAGIALLKPTVPAVVQPYIEMADYVLVFSGDLGHYGGHASLMQLEKVRLIRNIHPHAEVGWDGGANLDNAFSLAQGGIDVVNVGGAIHNATDPEASYRQLVDEINKHSVI